ncbi:MAG: hypothetical protein ACT6UH_26965, partial [Hydrogenophaga sp.]|uniref:hypothetical protein n=1 Tax=Hydrogenophaga sp. TaxID=1904254 RepID=UPI004035BBDF
MPLELLLLQLLLLMLPRLVLLQPPGLVQHEHLCLVQGQLQALLLQELLLLPICCPSALLLVQWSLHLEQAFLLALLHHLDCQAQWQG